MTTEIVSEARKRVALYVRLSTTGKGQDPDTQLMPLREWARSRGYTIHREYLDLGISGSKERRPALDLLMADARKRHFTCVIVARFDRFARSTKHLLAALAEFQALGIDFISLSEAIDTSTPMGKMVFTVMGAVAELERNLIRERVISGIERARKQGKRLGRPTVLVDEERVCDMVKSGRSLKSVALEVGVSRSKVRDILVKRGVHWVNWHARATLLAAAERQHEQPLLSETVVIAPQETDEIPSYDSYLKD